MEYFTNIKKISEKQYKHIDHKSKFYDELSLITYTVKLPTKKSSEDEIYIKNPFIQKCLPRACSFVIYNNTVIDKLEGPLKFGGYSPVDEDEEKNGADTSKLFDIEKIMEWSKRKELVIYETVKANGKYAICKVFIHNDKMYLVFGSKNSHHIIDISKINDDIICTDIVKMILNDIRKYINVLKDGKIFKAFTQGYSLVGELCDGAHFTDGDGSIYWFGLFKDGIPLSTELTFSLLQSYKLKTVGYEELDNSSEINKIFLRSRCREDEGSVLRFVNKITEEVLLVKSKSAIYIVKRFLRTILTTAGYKSLEKLRKRFIDAQNYHNLNTDASIRLTNNLYKFAHWLNSKCYPGTVLGCIPVKGVRGILPNGFNIYWKQFILEEYVDMNITEEDFGNFDEIEYLKHTELYKKRLYSESALVVFIQGIQGSGKSTIANSICEKLQDCVYYEQDMFWGDTNACQGAIYHSIINAKGPKIIIVSRCNIDESQYKKYLEMVHKLPTKVIFISPCEINELYFMISLSGIIKRSLNADKLLVGRQEYPIYEVIDFTKKNYLNFKPHHASYQINLYRNNEQLLQKSKEIIRSSDLDINNFIQKNYEKLNELRINLDEIVDKIIKIIKNPVDFIIPSNPLYIGLAINNVDKSILEEFIDKHIKNLDNHITYLNHCTLIYFGKNKTKNIEIKPGDIVKCKISSLIIRKTDNASAFKIEFLDTKILDFEQKYHITAKIPKNLNPNISNSFISSIDSKEVTIISYEKELLLTCFYGF